MRRAVAILLALLATVPAWARSPHVAELETVATRYHEDPTRLDRVREGLEQAVTTEPDAETWTALSRASFIWGDVRARTPEEKLQAYDRGREAGRRATELAPRSAAAHFWYGANTGRWGQTKGVLRSLFLLPEVQREIDAVIELDPNFTAVYALAGNVLYEVPGLLGGDLAKSEAMFRKGLALDPRFTSMRVGLAKTLIKAGRPGEARRELQQVLEEKNPRNPADWTVKDVPDARRLLETIRGK